MMAAAVSSAMLIPGLESLLAMQLKITSAFRRQVSSVCESENEPSIIVVW